MKKEENIEMFNLPPKEVYDSEGDYLLAPKHKDSFLQFWEAYPRHARASRAAAVRVWNKLPLTPALIHKIHAGLTRATQSAKWKEEPKFIPHARTWLNQHRWEDDIEPNAEIHRLKQYWKDCTTPKQKQYFIENYGEPKKLGIL